MENVQAYYRWILRHFLPFLGRRVIEVGAGTGNFAEILLTQSPNSELLLLEPAANLFPSLERRFAGRGGVKTVWGTLDGRASSFSPDAIVMVNVLEHIENDRVSLDMAWEVLPSGGHLLLFVPALPGIYGSLDIAFEHFRRYRKPELKEKLVSVGFRILEIRYFNFVGMAAWFLTGRILKRRTVNADYARFYDRWIVPPLSLLERFWEPPVGQSLLAVAQKPRFKG
jgi:SAM-dependent methyltransferase